MDQDYLLTLAAAPIYAALAGPGTGDYEALRGCRRVAIREARLLLADVRAQLDAERRMEKHAKKRRLPESYSAAGVGG